MSETTPEAPQTTGVENAEVQEGAETPNQPTTSPDVTITDDPGPAPTGDAPADGENVVPLDGNEGDPVSDDEAVSVLEDDESA